LYSGWLAQIAFNFTCIAIVGSIVELLFGRKDWLILYFIAGFVGEICGDAWQPSGAGASVAGAGLLGGLATWLVMRNATVQGQIGGCGIVAGAIVLTAWRDIHGPPILAGVLMALVMLRRGQGR
jgi:rhomboid protease GluP